MYVDYLEQAFADGYNRFEWMYHDITGEEIPVEITLVRVKHRGEYGLAGYIKDLRELKALMHEIRRAELAEESNRAKTNFLARMSHEIRTPMNAIMGIAEIQLQDHSIPQLIQEAFSRIHNSGDLLLGIINDILDLSKIDAGKLELNLNPYEIASLIHDTVQLNIMRVESKPIEFILQVDENVPAKMIGDELRIKQILNNILSNAFKYTEQGMICMTVDAEHISDKKDSDVILVLRVSDTGQGMTKEQVHLLGSEYSRFNVESNRKTEGTGLGMSITRNLIELMDGIMLVESELGKGSTFTVHLNQGNAGIEILGKDLAENLSRFDKNITSHVQKTQIRHEFMPYGRVLVVDDVETNLYVARGLMAPYGLSIDIAMSGFEAIDKLKDGSIYDIVFMDHMMPKMDGIEATKLIREMGYHHPVVALTANAIAGQAEIFLKNGFDEFISKPIDIRQLNQILNKLVRDKQPSEVIEAARAQRTNLYNSGDKQGVVGSQLAEFFVRDAEKSIAIFDAIYLNKCRRADDIAMFVINIHAMKSALANINEQELSSAALHLEQAGRDRKTEIIMKELPAFINRLKELVEKVRPVEPEETEEFDPELLHKKLLEIQRAAEALDKRGAKTTLTELKEKGWPPPEKNLINTIAENLLHSEFDEIIAAISEYLQK
jgi:signal transduction histidine kinase/FixJ family two-component response regulator